MTLTTDHVPGAPNWIDLWTPDLDATVRFYAAVFGWTFVSAGPDAGGYGFFQLAGATVTAVGPRSEADTPAWTVHFATDDTDTTAKAVEQAGGTIRSVMSGEFGTVAYATDPQGARFAVWERGPRPGLGAASVPGALSWVELHTPDRAAGRAFYDTVFGWTFQEVPFPRGTYITVAAADQADAMFGGIMPLEECFQPQWLPYFEVADPDATTAAAIQAGATVLMAPVDAPGAGRIACLTDPHGALFALIASRPAESAG